MGILLGIASAPAKGARLDALTEAAITVEAGVVGDVRGRRRERQVTVLLEEGWEAACRDLGVALPWLTRRANLFICGLAVPRKEERLSLGSVVLQVTSEAAPCRLMDQAYPGLQRALNPSWRGGLCCRVVQGGVVRVGDAVSVAKARQKEAA